MKKLARLGALTCFFMLAVSFGCSSQEETSSKKATKTMVSAGSGDEAAIVQIINDNAKALTEFPRTRNRQALQKNYAEDFEGINDGKSESPEEAEKFLADLEQQLDLGSPIGILNQVSNIKTSIHETIGWATYDYTLKIGIGGAVVVSDTGKCTSVLRREGTAWLIRHEHCSTAGKQLLRSSARRGAF